MNIEEAREIIIDEILNDTFLLSAFNQDASFESRQIKADAIETVLNELDKKDKVIDLMANSLITDYHDTEWVKEYFYNKLGG